MKKRLEDVIREMPDVLEESQYGYDHAVRGGMAERMETLVQRIDGALPTSLMPLSHNEIVDEKWTQDYEWTGRNVQYRISVERIK